MNPATSTSHPIQTAITPQNASARLPKPHPIGPAPPVPTTAPPAPPSHQSQSRQVNGQHAQNTTKGKKRADPPPVDPVTMYESVRSRIAALEEEEVLEEEEERRFAEEAQKQVRGLDDNAIHAKYIELFAEYKRLERDHAKEKQKLLKDKDAAKSQLTKANQAKIKMENLARELQKDNKRLREDGKRLAQSVEDAQDELIQMKNDLAKRADRARLQDLKYREMPDIVVKVICRYRAELFFKISRKTKLSRLFDAWTERMEKAAGKKPEEIGNIGGVITDRKPIGPSKQSKAGAGVTNVNEVAKADAASFSQASSASSNSTLQFIFSHNGRTIDPDQTPEDVNMDEADEILAVELMDLTEGSGNQEWQDKVEPHREKLKKNWTNNPQEAKRTLEEIFDGIVRDRLKEVLRLYELRERHFECVIRSKELEVLLSRARAAEQKQLAEGEKARADKLEDESHQLRKELEEAQNGHSTFVERLITYCKEPNTERIQRLITSVREELERNTPRTNRRVVDSHMGS
ncbi:hypothetical protein AMATHDRAFT_74319 [Amanita thiersii Skay4041]|uniref:Ubiquitin-like domain-containing protein n=1 Tax=Amanita thiersii Skay4041 TaxID=703135 RepID=A0A2A9NQ65_9AGAR|nr:hypothetical protein AMATHDRAFT_74319 [Amanita thiersii Skay4041]